MGILTLLKSIPKRFSRRLDDVRAEGVVAAAIKGRREASVERGQAFKTIGEDVGRR